MNLNEIKVCRKIFKTKSLYRNKDDLEKIGVKAKFEFLAL